jgi:hypothetical protein
MTQYRKLANTEIVAEGDWCVHENGGSERAWLSIGRVAEDALDDRVFYRPIRWQSEGWRFLDEGETLQEGDQFENLDGSWLAVQCNFCAVEFCYRFSYRRRVSPSEVYELRDGRMTDQIELYVESIKNRGKPKGIEGFDHTNPEHAASYANQFGLPVPGWRHPRKQESYAGVSLFNYGNRPQNWRARAPRSLCFGVGTYNCWLIPDTDEEERQNFRETLAEKRERRLADTRTDEENENDGALVASSSDNIDDDSDSARLEPDTRTRLQRVLDGDEEDPYPWTRETEQVWATLMCQGETAGKIQVRVPLTTGLTNPYREPEVGYDDQWGEEFEIWERE